MAKRLHRSGAILGALLLVMTLNVSLASAQASGSKAIVTGQTVTWTGEWEPVPDVGIAEPTVELLAFGRGNAIVGYGGTSFPVSASEVRDVLLEGFATDRAPVQIDRGDYDNVSYSIDLSTTDDITLATFTLVIENPGTTSMALLIAPPESFGASMIAAQGGIAIDGAPIFDGVDPAQMQATISSATGENDTAPTPAATAASADTPLGSLGEAINNGTPTPPAGDPTGASPANIATLPGSGVEIRYSNDWAIQQQDDTTLALGTVAAPPVLVTVVDLGPVAGGVDPAVLANGLIGQVESLADAEIVSAISPAPNRVVIVFRDPDSGGTLYRAYDLALDPVATTGVTMIVGADDLDAGVALVSSSITVDGAPAMADLPALVPAIFAQT